MKVLIIGSGGREHALAWRLAQCPSVQQTFITPGNPGCAAVATCARPTSATPHGFLHVAQQIRPDLTVVGPEAPLAAGIVDLYRAAGFRIVGPTAAAARLEASKAFAKEIMVSAGVPTADYAECSGPEQIRSAVRRYGVPVVLKADGLAAGKGVVIAYSTAEVETAIPQMLTYGNRVVVEEFLTGEEVSFIVICDGNSVLPLEASQDHKALNDGDQGPNTGGMGAYTDGRILTSAQSQTILAEVIEPTVAEMNRREIPFSGFLYAGLMMTSGGPKVLEFNARLGDPETQSLLHRMEGDFACALFDAASGALHRSAPLVWKPEPSVCVVLSAQGYPEKPRAGDRIEGIPAAEQTGAQVFQAGTAVDKDGNLMTAGGRVLGVTARGANLPQAIGNAYHSLKHIHFEGMHYRTDIGRKGLKRW